MQIHGPSDEADGSKFTAILNPGTIEPFAVVRMGHVSFYVHTADECDAAIRVWTEAKQLLLATQDDECPIEAHFPGEIYPCTLKRGHDGPHDFTPAEDSGPVTS